LAVTAIHCPRFRDETTAAIIAPKKHKPLTAREVWKDVFKEAQNFLKIR
jgi:hypothetical protein